MRNTTIEIRCHNVDAEQFMAVGFELLSQATDGLVGLIHRQAQRAHIICLVTFARVGVPFTGVDHGYTSAQPYSFAAADGRITCASAADCFDESGARAELYADARRRSEGLMAARHRNGGNTMGAAGADTLLELTAR